MSDIRREIELLIRAQLKGGRDIGQITRSINELSEAIDKQAAAAKRGESSYDGMRAAADALRTVQEELGARGTQLKRLEDLTKTLSAQKDAVDRAKKALEAYEQANSGERTAAQQKRVQSLTASYDRAQKRLLDLQRSQEILNTALRESGEDTNDLAGAIRRVADQQVAATSQQRRLNDELAQYAENVRKGREAAAELVRQQTLLNRLQEGNETDARAGRLQREAAATAELARQQLLLNRLQDGNEADARLGRDQQRALLGRFQQGNEADDQLGRQQAAAAAEQDAALRKQAAAAELAAKQYNTLARASTDLRPKVVSLRDAVNSIVNPADKSRETLAAVEKQINALSSAIALARGPVQDYSGQFKELQAAQKALAQQAGAIDTFRNQLQALRATRAELVAARAQVAQYAAEVRKGGDAGLSFVKPLAEAQTRLKAASAAMREQTVVTREARDALRAYGIDTKSLADAQGRVVTSTRATVAAIKQLGDQVDRNGESVRKAGKTWSLFNDEGRTTLSFTQRLRGELLALTTTYLGIQGAIGLAADSLKALNEQQGLRNTLAFALGGDPRAVADEISYLREQSERLGISFEFTSKAYAKFAAAGVKSGASVSEVREIFESFAEVGRVINLSPDQINGIFNALGQSFSKGKIQAEELRSQIGERLPGAFAFAQKALADVFPNLDKALEKGSVGAENLLLIAQSVRKAAGEQLPTAVKSLDAEQQRFNNSVLFFKQQIADAGFADAYIALLGQLTEYFRSADGKEFAKTLSQVAAAFVNSVGFVVEFRDEIQLLFLLFASVVASGMIARIGTGVVTMAGAFNTASVAAALLTPLTLTLANAFRVLSAAVGVFVAAYSLGTYLYEQSQSVRQFGALLIVSFAQIWSMIKFGAMELWEDLPRLAENGLKALINKTTALFRVFLEVFRVGANALGLTDLGDGIAKAIDSLTLKLNGNVSSRVAEIRKEAEADLKRIREIGKQMLVDAAGVAQTPQTKTATGTTTGNKPRKNTLPEDDDAAIKKRATEIAALLNALETVEAKTLKKQGDTLESLLAAVDKEYADLERRIAALGGKEGSEFASRFKNAVNALRTEIVKDFNDKLLAEQETLRKKLDQAEAAAGRKDKENLQSRLDAIVEQYAGTYREIADLRTKLEANGRDTGPADEARRRLDGTIVELQNLERLKFLKEELERKEKSINDLLKARELAIKAIENEVVAGTLQRGEADEQIRTLIGELEPEIQKATQAALEFALANRAAFDPNALQEFINKLREAQNSGKALKTEFDQTGQIIRNGIGSGVDSAFDALYDSLQGLIKGTNDWGDVFKSVGRSVLQTLANVLRELAQTIIKQMIMKAIMSSMGMGGGVDGFASAVGMSVHSGGVIGRDSLRQRSVEPGWFAGAPRYHSGGVVGLAPDEYPAILQENEEVLAKGDPRNVLNGGGKSSGGERPMRFVLVDDARKIPEAMAGAEGEEVFLKHIKSNLPTLRQWLKGR